MSDATRGKYASSNYIERRKAMCKAIAGMLRCAVAQAECSGKGGVGSVRGIENALSIAMEARNEWRKFLDRPENSPDSIASERE